MITFPSWESHRWHDDARNPLVSPLNEEKIKGVVGDPQIILPDEFDTKWHLFVWNNHGTPGFAHFESKDGRGWTFVYNLQWNCGPFYLTNDGTQWIACYTHYGENGGSTISARTSPDLLTWSEPTTLITPALDWEREGPRVQARNPNLCLLPGGIYRLYYSAGTVWMNDMSFEEPKYIGVAEADSLMGPFKKRERPIFSPDPKIAHRNYGAGALKVYGFGKQFLGILNGVYLDKESHSRSALNVYLSTDGIAWEAAPYNPIIAPSTGWKKALVYQLDLRYFEGKLLMYYNARDEWLNGKECIGRSTLEWNGEVPRKLWGLM
jgi:hypothetical protein